MVGTSRLQMLRAPLPSAQFPPSNPSFFGTTWGPIGPFSTLPHRHQKAGSPLPTGLAANEPGGSRTHDLRIKSQLFDVGRGKRPHVAETPDSHPRNTFLLQPVATDLTPSLIHGCLLGQSARPLVQGGIELCRTRDRQLAVRRDSVMSDASPPGAGPNRRFVTPNM